MRRCGKIANANQNLHLIYPMNGETRRARSMLSWHLANQRGDTPIRERAELSHSTRPVDGQVRQRAAEGPSICAESIIDGSFAAKRCWLPRGKPLPLWVP